MLSDSVRTSSYRDTLVKNPDSLRDALVLDIGCGTGILSMFDAQSGGQGCVGGGLQRHYLLGHGHCEGEQDGRQVQVG